MHPVAGKEQPEAREKTPHGAGMVSVRDVFAGGEDGKASDPAVLREAEPHVHGREVRLVIEEFAEVAKPVARRHLGAELTEPREPGTRGGSGGRDRLARGTGGAQDLDTAVEVRGLLAA